MTVQVVIDVAGEPAGTPGVAREFVFSKVSPTPPLVTLSLASTVGITQFNWEILDQPPGASATLSNPAIASPTFTPTAAIPGTYLIRCTVNAGADYGENAVAWKTKNLSVRIPAVGEQLQFGVDGWDPALRETILTVDDGLDKVVTRKAAVLDYVVSTAVPPSENLGDRYILDDSGAPHANWDGAAQLDIVQFDGVNWVKETPLEGWVAYVDAKDKDARYVDDGAGQWEFISPGASITPTGYVYVDIANGDDVNGIGSPDNPYQTLEQAVAVKLAELPTTQAEYETPLVFLLAPGTYDHTGTGFIKLPFRAGVAIVGRGVQIDGDIYFYQDPAQQNGSTLGASLYIGAGDTPPIILNGDVIAKNDNAVPGTSFDGPRTLVVEKILHNGNVYNAKSGNTNGGEGTGDLFYTSLQAQNPSGAYFFGEGEDNDDLSADENRIVILGYTSIFFPDFTGNIAFRNLQNCWIYGDVRPDNDPVTPAIGTYKGRAEGWGQKTFWNTVFNGTNYEFGDANARVGTPDDLYFDANSWSSLADKSPTFTDNDYVLEDEAIGIKLDSTGLVGNLKGGVNTSDAAHRRFDSHYGAGDSTIIVRRGSTDEESAANLLSAWILCKNLTPGGNAIGPDNKATFLVPPGVYNFEDGKWTIDAEHIEIFGLGESKIGTAYLSQNSARPPVILYGDVATSDPLVEITVQNVNISGFTVRVVGPRVSNGVIITSDFQGSSMSNIYLDVAGGIGLRSTNAITYGFFENISTDDQFLAGGDVRGDFRFCYVGNNSFAGWDVSSSRDSIFRGNAYKCKAGTWSFGASQNNNGHVYGIIESCTAGDDSFGASGTATKQGRIFNSAAIIDCGAGDRSFGYSEAADGIVEGRLDRCVGGSYCFGSTGDGANFGGEVYQNGYLTDCTASNYSFGGSDDGDPSHDRFLGIASNCHGGQNCFGTKNDFNGVLQNCSATGRSFGGTNGTVVQTIAALHQCSGIGLFSSIRAHSLLISHCTFETSEGVSEVVRIVDDNNPSKIYHSTLLVHPLITYSITSVGTKNVKLMLTGLNKPVDPNITNLISPNAFNPVDPDIA